MKMFLMFINSRLNKNLNIIFNSFLLFYIGPSVCVQFDKSAWRPMTKVTYGHTNTGGHGHSREHGHRQRWVRSRIWTRRSTLFLVWLFAAAVVNEGRLLLKESRHKFRNKLLLSYWKPFSMIIRDKLPLSLIYFCLFLLHL